MSSAPPEPAFTTWDGLPVARDRPHGSSVVVRRPGPHGLQLLVLHRAFHGVDFDGDWAWTSPAGARLPGEPVAAGAARELFEEAGLTGYDVWPVDLSQDWAIWGCDVPAGADATLHDAEHDRFEWLAPERATARCLPAMIGANLSRVAQLPRVAVTVRPAAPADLDAVMAWRAAPHVRRRFGPVDDAGRAQLVDRLAGRAPVRLLLIVVDGLEVGYVQRYRIGHPADQTVGLDFLLGVPELTGQGLGARALWCALRYLTAPGSGIRRVVADPGADNRASIAALAKAGFTEVGRADPDRPGATDRVVMALDVGHWLGPDQPRR
jgi:aminoglycoside 6'-N-acetyltransferase